MPNVILTRAAHDAIRAAARYPFRDTSIRRADGTFSVPLADDTFERLVAEQMAGETISDTIVRIAILKATAGRKN